MSKAKRLRRWISGLIALSLILAATVIGTASLMFPWLLSHPEKVQSFLSERLKRPVQFERLTGRWRAQGPIFSLDELRIGGEKGAPILSIASAELAFDFYAFLHRGRSWYQLNIVAPRIDVQRDGDGRWQVRQWSGGRNFDLKALRNIGAIGLRDARINISDLPSGRQLKLVDAELSISESRHGRSVFARFRTESGSVPMQVACNLDTAFANGHCYFRGRALRAQEWLSTWPVQGVATLGGTLDVDVWVDLVAFQPQRVHLELAAEEVSWRGLRMVQLSNGQSVEPRFSPDRMAVAMRWQRESADGWNLALIEGDSIAESGADATSRLSINRVLDATNVGTTRIEVQSLRLERLLPWLALSDALSPAFAGTLYEAAPSGELRDLVWNRIDGGASDIRGQFRGVGLQATRKLPRVQGVSGRVSGDELATLFHLDAVVTDFSYPGVFRHALPVSIDPLLIALMPQTDGLRIGFEQLHVRGEGFEFEGSLALMFSDDGGRPEVEAVLRVLPSSLTAAKALWPVNVMPAVTVQWLDRALESGRIDGGVAAIRGDLDDWPFGNGEGRFDAMVAISDTQVKFNPLWPQALLHSARVQFINHAMQIGIPSAEMLGSPIHDANVSIDDLKLPELIIDAHSASDGVRLLELIRNSPLQQKFGAELVGVSVDGAADVDVVLQLPLRKDLGPLRANGRVTLHDAELRDLKWNLRFDRANGSVRFSDHGFSADALSVHLQEDVAELSIALGEFVANDAHQLEASLRGELSMQSVMAGVSAMQPHLARFPGKSQWDLTLLIGVADAQGQSTKHLALRSDLQGIAVDLPAPLRKDAATAMPFELELSLPLAGSQMRMQLGQLARFNAVAATPERLFSGHLALGGGLADSLPMSGLRISGEAPAIDLGGWASLDVDGDGSSVPLQVDVHAEEVDVLGRAFSNTSVRIVRGENQSSIVLKGDGVDGTFELASVNSDVAGITARFKTLHWPEAGPSGQSKPLDPGLVPPLHIWVGDLRLGAAEFGEARIETRPSETGMRIQELTTRSPTLTMRASGSWELKADGEESALDITFSAEDIGKMLNGLGYGSVIKGGQTVARLNAVWPGSPAQFALHRVRGTLQGEVGEGRILEVEPGAGRLFGLVNFASIPRRLSLDFSDFFKSGMAFDSIKGSFALNAGDAVTDDLRVEAPSAEIMIKGRAGLVARDYDQEMEVVPRVRSALPLVGAVAGGPVGAVVGVLAQDMLRKPLDEIVTARYRVHGSWDKPEVVLIAKEKRRLEPLPQRE